MSEVQKRALVTKTLVNATPRLPRDRKAEVQNVVVKRRLFEAMSRLPKNSA